MKTALHWALVVAALAYTAYKAPPLFSAAGDEFRNLGQVRWGWAAVALFLGLAALAVYGELQRELLVVGGAPLPATTVQGITFAQNAIAVTVPVVGGAVAIGYAISRFHRRAADTPVASWAVLLAGSVTTLCLAGMTAIALAAVGRLTVLVAGVLLVAIASVAVGGWQLVTHPTGLRSIVRPVLHLAQHVPGRCPSCRASRLAQLDSRVDGVANRLGLLRPSPARWLLVLALGCLSFGLDFAGLSAASAAVLPGVPWAALVWGYLLVQGSIALQILPGGAGLAEVGLLGALTGAGVGAAPAAGVVLLYRIASWLLPAAIGWVAYAVQIHGIRPLPHRHAQPAMA